MLVLVIGKPWVLESRFRRLFPRRFQPLGKVRGWGVFQLCLDEVRSQILVAHNTNASKVLIPNWRRRALSEEHGDRTKQETARFERVNEAMPIAHS